MRHSDLALAIRNMLADQLGQTWDDATVALAITYACKEYVKRTGATRQWVNDLEVPYDGVISAPTDYIDIARVQYLTKDLVKTSRSFEVTKNENWEYGTGTTAKRWLFYGGDKIRLTPSVQGWMPIGDGSITPGVTCTIKVVGDTDWSIASGVTGYVGVTGAAFVAAAAGGTGTGYVWELDQIPYAYIEYVQSATPISTTGSVDSAALVTGTTYEITAVGGTGIDWTTIGAAASTTGTTFVTTGSTTAGGSAVELIDERIPEKYQEYLKYAAANYLLRMQNDQESIAKADKYLADFNALIGPMNLY